jgi:hypothetical protein
VEIVSVYRNPDGVRREASVRDALRFALVVTVVGGAALVVAAVWVSTCAGATADTLACGVPQRTLLAVAAPAILLIGGLLAFVRTYRSWRKHEAWWAWQGAGWILMALTVLVLTTSVPAVAGRAGLGA